MDRREVMHHVSAAPSQPLAYAPTLVRDEMKYWLLRPDARLRREVRCYFVVEADRRRSCKHELHLPDGYSELVFTLRTGFERLPLGCETERKQMMRSYLVGARSHSIETRDAGDVRVIGVKLEPRMLRRLIRVPLSEFRDSTVELRDLNERSLLNLEDAIDACSTTPQVVAALDSFFLGQLRASAPTQTLADHLIERIRAHRGAITISECMHDSGLDARTLERSFAACVGMTPKKYARIVRFKHAYHALLTDAAYARCTGRGRLDHHLDAYYDQSHFYKDFRFFTGTSPVTLLASRSSASTAVTDHLLEGDLSTV